MAKNKNSDWAGFENLRKDNELFPSDLKYAIKNYSKNQLIFSQGDLCNALYILIDGSVKTEMITENGNVLNIELITAPNTLAPAFLFAENNHFPVNVTSLETTEIMGIPKEEVVRLMTTQPDFMKEFMTHNANRIQFLTSRLQMFSIKTIRGKLAHFLLEKAPDNGQLFIIKLNQTQLAEFLGVARSSLARCLSDMVQEGLISIHKKEYQILNYKGLKELLE